MWMRRPIGSRRFGPGARLGAFELWLVTFGLAASATMGGAIAPPLASAKVLIPMDDRQTDHLKAYGIAYWALTRGQRADWLLNYRGGSFLLPDDPATERECNVRGVSFEAVGGAQEASIRAEIADNNMESVVLEKAPKVAVYIPPNTPPWDDAVTLALKYAEIPYATVWDEEVLRGDLPKYDWLHLHHEDFTGQHGKFYAAYHSFPWYQEEEAVQLAMAHKLGFAKEFGATHAVNAKSESVVERARELTQGRGVDYAFDAIGGEATTLQIVDAIRPGGTAVIVGMAALNVRAPITPYMMALHEKTLKGTIYGSVRPHIDFPRLVDFYLDGRLKLDQLISRTYRLDQINEGFEALRSGQVARGVIVFN